MSRCYHALILMMGTGIFLVSSQLRTRQETERKANTYILYISLIFRSEEHTSELQSLMRISYAVFCLKKKTHKHNERVESQYLPMHQNYDHRKLQKSKTISE